LFFSQEAISYIDEWNSIQRKTEVAALVARKVANQFLNKIILSCWSDIWINEGIATFLGMHVLDKVVFFICIVLFTVLNIGFVYAVKRKMLVDILIWKVFQFL